MLNISKGVNLTLDEQGRIQAEGLKRLPHDHAHEIRQLIKANRQIIVEYLTLWSRAWTLADYVDGGDSIAPYPERIKKLPELNRMTKRMKALETGFKLKAFKPGISADCTRCPALWMPGSTPTDQDRNTCPACGKNHWWRLDKPDSKRICARCHPPATGLDVVLERL